MSPVDHTPTNRKARKGERRLSIDWLERIGRVLNVDPVELIIGSPANAGGMSNEVAREVGHALGVVGLGGRPPLVALIEDELVHARASLKYWRDQLLLLTDTEFVVTAKRQIMQGEAEIQQLLEVQEALLRSDHA